MNLNKLIELTRKIVYTLFYYLGNIFVWCVFIATFCGGVFQIAAYDFELGGRERNIHKMEIGVMMLTVLFLIWIFYKYAKLIGNIMPSSYHIYIFYTNIYHKDNLPAYSCKEMDPNTWPESKIRSVRGALRFMSKKTGLVICDIILGCVLGIWFFLSFLFIRPVSFNTTILPAVRMAGVWFIVRLCVFLFYYFHNNTKSMIHYCRKYNGLYAVDEFLSHLKRSLREKLIYYSPRFIITEEYFMAWCETDLQFHPIAIPVKDMRNLRYEVRENEHFHRKNDTYAVIVCQLRNGKSVDLYVEDRYKSAMIWEILNELKIPFENAAYPGRSYMEAEGVTVTNPNKNVLK